MIKPPAWLAKAWRARFHRYEIDDPRPVAASAPYTFYLPSENELLAIAPGDLVKIIFRAVPPSGEWEAERMWVIVTEAQGEALAGTLANEPSDMPQIKYGDGVRFRRSDVIDIDWAEDRAVAPRPPRPTANIGTVASSTRASSTPMCPCTTSTAKGPRWSSRATPIPTAGGGSGATIAT